MPLWAEIGRLCLSQFTKNLSFALLSTKNMRIIAIFLLCLAFTGCASSKAVHTDRDPNERIVVGTVIDKEIPASSATEGRNANSTVMNILKGTLEAAGEVIARITIVGGIATVILLDAMDQDETENPPLTYTVKSTEGKVYIVLSKYPGFSVGECVDLFISSDLEQYPPRMASGNSC
jgi:hypothetical protein